MTPSQRYATLFEQAETSVAYWSTPPLTEFSRSLDRLIRMKLTSQAALATKMGVSRAYISKVLRGDSNLTVTAMAKIAMALGAVIHIHVAEKNVGVRWVEVIESNDKLVNGIDKMARIEFGTAQTEQPCGTEVASPASTSQVAHSVNSW
jgi:transcriptional regulator with XRE-family HTH domain